MLQAKVLPSAIKSEENILGSIIINGARMLEDVLDIFGGINPFYNDKHSAIYDFIKELYTKGYSIDLIVITEQLKNNDIKNRAGEPYYFVELTNKIIHSADIDTHCRIVLEAFQMRKLIELSGEAISSAYKNNESPLEVISELEKGISSIAMNNDNSELETIEQSTKAAMENIVRRLDNPSEITGIPSGFKDIDAITGGWQQPDLIIIAARPSVGKSAFAINCAYNAAKHGKRVAMFSLEMSNEQVTQRMLSMSSLVRIESLRTTSLSGNDLIRLKESSLEISKLPLYLDDTAGLNIYQLKSKVRKIQRKHGLDMIIIDYLQLMSSLNEKNINTREQEISKISRDLKNLAKELEIPIIALSQLSRGIESRATPEPRLSDLRESGAIEQDADFVAFLARPDYQKVNGADDPSFSNKAMFFIRKHRNGRLDDVMLSTDLSTQRFLDNTESYNRLSKTGGTSAYNSQTIDVSIGYNENLPF